MKKEVKEMPSLKHLLEDLKEIDVDPNEVHIPGQLYDDLVDQADSIADEDDNPAKNPDEED
jgi:hypothetical protein